MGSAATAAGDARRVLVFDVICRLRIGEALADRQFASFQAQARPNRSSARVGAGACLTRSCWTRTGRSYLVALRRGVSGHRWARRHRSGGNGASRAAREGPPGVRRQVPDASGIGLGSLDRGPWAGGRHIAPNWEGSGTAGPWSRSDAGHGRRHGPRSHGRCGGGGSTLARSVIISLRRRARDG